MSSISESIGQLRQKLVRLERNDAFSLGADESSLPLGLSALDGALEGGLALGALHEFAPAGPDHLGAAFGFALAIAIRSLLRPAGSAKHVLLIETDFGAFETGKPYWLEEFGLSLGRLLILRAPRPFDALWAFEEALKSRAFAAVISELPGEGAAADLTATRRLSLAARASDTLGLLMRHRAPFSTTTAMTRWQIAAAPSEPDGFGGIGCTAFELSLNKNRRGRCGRFMVRWNHATRSFVLQALSLGLAQTVFDRPDQARASLPRLAGEG
jgi:protein ImuA